MRTNLRAKYPQQAIDDAAMCASGMPEFARLGYIELVDARINIPNGLPPGLVRTIKRAKYQPIWVPGRNFPNEPLDIFEQMQPSLRGNEIMWQNFPAKRPSTWRDPIPFSFPPIPCRNSQCAALARKANVRSAATCGFCRF